MIASPMIASPMIASPMIASPMIDVLSDTRAIYNCTLWQVRAACTSLLAPSMEKVPQFPAVAPGRFASFLTAREAAAALRLP